MTTTVNGNGVKHLLTEQLTNDAEDMIELGMPYRLAITVVGTADLLMHRWSNEAVAEKARAAKGSTAKKTDNVESYAYRDDDGNLGVPGINFAASIWHAGKFMQDPRSPRKSAFDLCRAGVIPLDKIAPFQPMTQEWDYDHMARVTVQRAGITRTRPAMRTGWELTFNLLITTPQYLPFERITELVTNAGLLVGLCDFRPTYGRFTTKAIEVLRD